MKIFDRAMKVGSPGEQVKGKWFPIQFTPDVFTGERMNLGVGFVEGNGVLHYRLLDSFHRISCLYDDRVQESDLKYLVQMLQDFLPEKVEQESLLSPSSNISFGQMKPASGNNVDNLLNQFFDEMVTLAVPFPDKRVRIVGYDTEDVRKMTFKIINEKTDIQAHKIIAENPMFRVEDENGKAHFLDIPLRGRNRLGTLISACQTATTVRQNIMEATIDLHTAASAHRDDSLNCFIMRQEDRNEKQQRDIDNAIDKLDWKMQTQGIGLEVTYTPEATAEKIMEWGGLH